MLNNIVVLYRFLDHALILFRSFNTFIAVLFSGAFARCHTLLCATNAYLRSTDYSPGTWSVTKYFERVCVQGTVKITKTHICVDGSECVNHVRSRNPIILQALFTYLSLTVAWRRNNLILARRT